MKKCLCVLLCLALFLSACGQKTPALVGVWVNAGQYSEGRDFVETLTLDADGGAVVHLEYRGEDYATLEGRWTAAGDNLSVDFTDPNARDRIYQYTLTEDALTLTGDGKTVEYIRK